MITSDSLGCTSIQMRSPRQILLLIAFWQLILAVSCLPRLSVSGGSSGGFMAVQFHVAHSSVTDGAGIIAGGPYYCIWSAPPEISVLMCSRDEPPIILDELYAATAYAELLEVEYNSMDNYRY